MTAGETQEPATATPATATPAAAATATATAETNATRPPSDGRGLSLHLGTELRIAAPGEPGTGLVVVRPDLCDTSGALRAGVLFTLADNVGGHFGAVSAYPDWVVTADLSLRVLRPATTGTVHATGALLRKGRTTVVVEVELSDELGREVARAIVTSTVLTPSFDVTGMLAGRPRQPSDPPPISDGPPLFDWLGILSAADWSWAEMVITEPLRNPWGILHGGAASLLVEAAALGRAQRALGSEHPSRVGSMVLRYLNPNRVGPLRAGAEIVGLRHGIDGRPDAAQVRIDVRDTGAGNRQTIAATVTVESSRPIEEREQGTHE